MVALAVEDVPEKRGPGPAERLRQAAVAVSAEYFSVTRAAGDAKVACPGCQVRENERRDLVAEATLETLHAALLRHRLTRVAEWRLLATERQLVLPL